MDKLSKSKNKKKYFQLKSLLKENKGVFSNYFFLTIIQILNSFFYLIIYPFLIRTLGAESYGLYVFLLSIVNYFTKFVSFGFDLPALKRISQNSTDKKIVTETLSGILSAKIYLELIAFVVFCILLVSIPFLRENWLILIIIFSQTLVSIFFPQWYYQGLQKMSLITYIQLFLKVLSIPLILILVKGTKDIWIFALISSSFALLGAIIATFMIKLKDHIQLEIIGVKCVLKYYKEAFPFFLSNWIGVLKEQTIFIVIGAFLGMKDVAYYDLGNKIVMLFRTLLWNVNGAIFPKVIANINYNKVKRIMHYELLGGLFVILIILAFGKWFVLLMGGKEMLEAYWVALILSPLVLTWLIVGSYVDFIFTSHNKFYYVTQNQIVALLSFVVFCAFGLIFSRSVIVFSLSITLSGLAEIIYCTYITKRQKLL